MFDQEAEGDVGVSVPPFLDWRSDLKVSDLDTCQLLIERQALMSKQMGLKPHNCPSLSE